MAEEAARAGAVEQDGVPARKQRIVAALHRCIRERGYASTSLTDIAIKAEMSPSHIRYYFAGKDAILRSYFAMLCEDILHTVRNIRVANPQQWLADFSRFYMGNPRISRAGLSVIVEIFGVAMHDEEMRILKAKFDAEMHEILRGFFERAGCAEGLTPQMAAELARAMDIGLKYSTAFAEMPPEELGQIYLSGIDRLLPNH